MTLTRKTLKGRIQAIRSGTPEVVRRYTKYSDKCKRCGTYLHKEDAHCSACGSLDHIDANCPEWAHA